MAKIGYVRVSNDKQDPASQIKLMQDMGIPAKDIFVDTAISGAVKPESRPTFRAMLKRINETKDVDELVFSEFSRIGRTVDDSLMALIPIKQMGITIRSLSQSEKFINELPGPLQSFMISGMISTCPFRDLCRKNSNYKTSHSASALYSSLFKSFLCIFNLTLQISGKIN